MPRVLLFTDAAMLDHRPPGGHPERPERLAAILNALKGDRLLALCSLATFREASDDELLRVHMPPYLEVIRAAEVAGGARLEVDTWTSFGSEKAARLAAGAVVAAASAVIEGKSSRAFCAVRPPGHHARPATAMGFCLFGNVAVAAAHALAALGLERVLIADFDVHHGNGTQEMFYEDPRVGFLSIHRYPFYPGTGAADETGTGAGLGFTKNVPVAFGTPRPRIVELFRAALESLADHVRPELVIVSAGFDAHALDPIGSLRLEVEDFVAMTRDVLDVAKVHSCGRVVSVLEGGYNVPILVECVTAHVETLAS
jgi:acetoin utilization deacetylase AcuC-like enzyme